MRAPNRVLSAPATNAHWLPPPWQATATGVRAILPRSPADRELTGRFDSVNRACRCDAEPTSARARSSTTQPCASDQRSHDELYEGGQHVVDTDYREDERDERQCDDNGEAESHGLAEGYEPHRPDDLVAVREVGERLDVARA